MSNENEELKALKCSSCGGELVKSYRYDDEEEENIPLVKCASCGTEYDQHTQEYYEFLGDEFTTDVNDSIFKLGAKGTLNGIEYEIIGRLRMQDEDDYEISTWDEWLAISADGVYHYIVEEDGKFTSYESYVPQSIDMESNEDYIEFEGKSISKSSAYTARIVFFEGELTWAPEKGEPLTCYDIKQGGVKYSIEQSEGEISITKGTDIPHEEILNAFATEEQKAQYQEKVLAKDVFKKKSWIYLAVAIISFVLFIISFTSGKVVSGIMDSSKIKVLNDNQQVVDKGRINYHSQVLYGPFDVTQKDTLYTLKVYLKTAIQPFNLEWQSFNLYLILDKNLAKVTKNQLDFLTLKKTFDDLNELKDPIESFAFSGSFWDETGYDSDGYWHEYDISADTDFVLDDSGKYYIYLDLYSQKWRNILSVRVFMESTKSHRYYLILFFIFLTLFYLNRSKYKY